MTAPLASRSAAPFHRVVVGIDGSPQALEAARQAVRLTPGTAVTLAAAIDTLREAWTPDEVPALAHLRREEAAAALAAARAHLDKLGGAGRIRAVIEEGRPANVLRYIAAEQDDLVALGTRAESTRGSDMRSRLQEPVVLPVVREVSCSVLVARTARHPLLFPRVITAGIDGSEPSLAAHAIAAQVAASADAELHCVVALGGKAVDFDAVAQAIPGVPLSAIDRRRPLDALLAAAEESDLLVVGNRGLHGLRALGSVSERVVARAECSVLVVRT